MITIGNNKHTYTSKNGFTGSFWRKKYNGFLKKGTSPYALDAANFGSKILISPLMILLIGPFTKEWKNHKDRDAIKASAILHPIQAGLTLAFATVTSLIANKITDYYARKGTLGNAIDPQLGDFFNPAKNPKNLSKLKNINTVIFTLAMIPVATLVLDKLLPKILKCDKHEDSDCKDMDNVYTARLKFGGGKLYG